MAAAITFNKKLSLGGGTYMYLGSCVLTGTYTNPAGETVTVAAGERYASASASGMPERIDYMEIEGFAGAQVSGQTAANAKLKLLITVAAKKAGEQVENGATIAGTYPFMMIGA